MKRQVIQAQHDFEVMIRQRMSDRDVSVYSLAQAIARRTGRSFVSTNRRIARAISGQYKIDLNFAIEIAEELGLELSMKGAAK